MSTEILNKTKFYQEMTEYFVKASYFISDRTN